MWIAFGGRHKAEEPCKRLAWRVPSCRCLCSIACSRCRVAQGRSAAPTAGKAPCCVTGPHHWTQAAPGNAALEGCGTDPGCSGRWQTETHPKGRVILRISQHPKGFREDGTCTSWSMDSCKEGTSVLHLPSPPGYAAKNPLGCSFDLCLAVPTWEI